jgi:hypothetical protein
MSMGATGMPIAVGAVFTESRCQGYETAVTRQSAVAEKWADVWATRPECQLLCNNCPSSRLNIANMHNRVTMVQGSVVKRGHAIQTRPETIYNQAPETICKFDTT